METYLSFRVFGRVPAGVFSRVIGSVLGALLCTSVFADVNYQIDLTQPEQRLALVSVQFPKSEQSQLLVNLPVWRTGQYQVLPLANGVRLFTASDSRGQPLEWQRLASGQWQVTLSEPTAVKVEYQLYANELAERVRDISDSHAYLDASGVFMYSPQFRDQEVKVKLLVPDGWKSYSGMNYGDGSHSFVADNYDVLVGSPIETGINKHFPFKASGKQYELLIWGEGNYDKDQIIGDLTKLSEQAGKIWGDYPYERFLYMLHATDGVRGATEHINSTIIQIPRFGFRERKDYLRFISLASHELIHAWNVKSYRPKTLASYEYQQESLSDLLWVAEGSTSYFEEQLLLRSEITTAKEFFDDLAYRIGRSQKYPGKEQQSLQQASLNQWVFSWGDYADNQGVNIYSEGYLTSLALDFALLEDTELKQSYASVHRALYEDYRLPKGYDADDIKAILQELSGKSYHAWWQQHVNRPFSQNFPALLDKVGLLMTHKNADNKIPYAGMKLKTGTNVLNTVLRDGPAWQAGLVVGDEILAINGLKLPAKNLFKRIKDYKAGDKISVTIFRGDNLKTLKLTLGQEHKNPLIIKGQSEASQAQKAFFKAWLGIDWPFDEEGNL